MPELVFKIWFLTNSVVATLVELSVFDCVVAVRFPPMFMFPLREISFITYKLLFKETLPPIFTLLPNSEFPAMVKFPFLAIKSPPLMSTNPLI